MLQIILTIIPIIVAIVGFYFLLERKPFKEKKVETVGQLLKVLKEHLVKLPEMHFNYSVMYNTLDPKTTCCCTWGWTPFLFEEIHNKNISTQPLTDFFPSYAPANLIPKSTRNAIIIEYLFYNDPNLSKQEAIAKIEVILKEEPEFCKQYLGKPLTTKYFNYNNLYLNLIQNGKKVFY